MSHETGRASYIIGDVRDALAAIPDGSVDLVLTSPPFLALRSYLPADHPDKHREIGAEPDPASFIDTLLALTAEWRRVIAPHGSICVELGDTYSGSGGAGGDYNADGLREGQAKFSGSAAKRAKLTGGENDRPAGVNRGGMGGRASMVDDATGGHHMGGTGWPMAKSLCGIPHLYHLSLAYGRNILTGTPSPAGAWRVRNVVSWTRPNPPVGALGDKFRPATSYMTIATVDSPKMPRYFDLDAVRTPAAPGKRTDWTYTEPDADDSAQPGNSTRKRGGTLADNPGGAPPLDYWRPTDLEVDLWHEWADQFPSDLETWEIPTVPYPGSHYAVYPPTLCERPIKTMVPLRVCLKCGQPSRRIVEAESSGQNIKKPGHPDDATKQIGAVSSTTIPKARTAETVGWTDCGHDQWRAGIVLDPFAGSGTTLMVATGLGRNALGIDFDDRNAHLASDRCGMFLDTYTLAEWTARDGAA